MSKHTPGPWKAVYVGSSDWDLDGPVTEQDWKLAAAAPELLQALRTLLSYANVLEMRLIDADGEHRAMQQARAAIARAEGKT
jgi:hypothetical protein